MDAERTALLRRAARYASLRQEGARPRFPQDLTIRLLSSEVEDVWTGGLYLISQLRRETIARTFFEVTSTYRALATFLAAGLAAYRAARLRLGAAWSEDDALAYFRNRWRAPNTLIELALAEYHAIVQRLFPESLGSEPVATPHPSRIAILVHGTLAAKATWWQPTIGGFWQHVHGYWPHLYDGPVPFAWSGVNSHGERVIAAQKLVRWAQTVGANVLDVIAHSHGGNVCLLAARMGLPINRLILLGTPIRTEYMVDLGRITSLANVFSLGDHVQTPIGTFPHGRGEGRTLSDSVSVSNWRAENDGTGGQPGHSELHEPATWNASKLNDLLL